MGFSYDEFRIAADRSRSACSGSDWAYCWEGMPAWAVDCSRPVLDPVFGSLGSEKMTRWTKMAVSPCPISRRLSSRRHAAQRNRSRNCRRNWLQTIPAGSIVGSKRECQSTERLFCSRHSERPSKKLRQLGHQLHHCSHIACRSDSTIRKSRPNSVEMDCDNPKTSASKSTEGNSEYLRCRSMSLVWVRRIVLRELTEEQTRELSVMRMPSYLYSLLRNGGWNSLASANVRKPCAAFVICCFRVGGQSVYAEASSVEVIRKKATSTGWDSVPNHLREHIVGLDSVPSDLRENIDGSLRVRWFWERQQSVPSETIPVGLNSEKPTTTTWDSVPNDLREHIVGLCKVRRFWKRQQSLPSGTISEKANTTKPSTTTRDSLPNHIHENILQRVDFQDLPRFKGVSKDWRKFIEGEAFRQSRGRISEGSFTAIHYYIKNQSWRCTGYDLHSKSWKALPPFSYLPFPDAELFKEYSVCGHGALMCADVSKSRKGELVVFNPLTGKTKALPPLLYPRNPVLRHFWFDSFEKSYKVIVAGSTTSSQNREKPNWKIMEVFDSSTSEWKEACNIPGPAFGLSKHQTGVIVNGRLFFISYMDDYRHPRGDYILAFDMENGRYLKNWVCPIPAFVPDSKSLLQLVENDGKVYLFSESKEDVQRQGVHGPGIVCLRIDEMEFHDRNQGAAACQWRNVVEVRKTGVQEIPTHPDLRRGVADFMCVGFGEGKLCIFNTHHRDGVVYDMLDGMQCEVLEPPPAHQTGNKFFILNPASFTLHPSFASDP